MKYYILIICFLYVTISLSAQEILSLRAVPFFNPSTENIHIASVLDERIVKHLGIQENLNKEQIILTLNGGAEKAVKDFYDLTLSKDSLSQGIYIRIKALNVQESKRRMNDGITSVARTHISLVFLRKQNNNLKEIFSIKHNEDETFALDNKPMLYATHEKRIRAALEYCMHAFLKNYKETKNLIATPSFKPIIENDKIETKLGEWFNLVTIKGMQSRYFQGYGISYTGFVDSKKGFIRPYEASFEVNWARADVAEENGYADVNSFVFRPEIYFVYKRLFKGVYASMSANIPIGYELLEDLEGDNSFNFVIGAGASQGLRFIPWQDKGGVLGIDFFQQLESSRVYRFDLGIEIVLGINF